MRLHEKNSRVSLRVQWLFHSQDFSLNSCSHYGFSEHDGFVPFFSWSSFLCVRACWLGYLLGLTVLSRLHSHTESTEQLNLVPRMSIGACFEIHLSHWGPCDLLLSSHQTFLHEARLRQCASQFRTFGKWVKNTVLSGCHFCRPCRIWVEKSLHVQELLCLRNQSGKCHNRFPDAPSLSLTSFLDASVSWCPIVTSLCCWAWRCTWDRTASVSSSNCTVTKRWRSWTYTCAWSFVCTSHWPYHRCGVPGSSKSFFTQHVHRRSRIDYEFSLFWLFRRRRWHYPDFGKREECIFSSFLS